MLAIQPAAPPNGASLSDADIDALHHEASAAVRAASREAPAGDPNAERRLYVRALLERMEPPAILSAGDTTSRAEAMLSAVARYPYTDDDRRERWMADLKAGRVLLVLGWEYFRLLATVTPPTPPVAATQGTGESGAPARVQTGGRELGEVINYALGGYKKQLPVEHIFAIRPTDANGWRANYLVRAIQHHRPDIAIDAPNASMPSSRFKRRRGVEQQLDDRELPVYRRARRNGGIIPTDRAEVNVCEALERRGVLVRDRQCANMRFKLPDAAADQGAPSSAPT